MLELEKRRTLDRAIVGLQWVVGALVALLGAALRFDSATADWPNFLEQMLDWLRQKAWIGALFGPPTIALLQWSRRKYGNPWVWETIQGVLDEIRKDLFGKLEGDPLDQHRVTLFRYCRVAPGLRWPSEWFDRLCAVARSNHLTKSGISSFHAPDNPKRCEGVAGHAFRYDSWRMIGAQQPLNPPTSISEHDLLEAYAEATFVSEEWVRDRLAQGRPLPICFGAVTIFVKGRPWGVLVIDSAQSGTITAKKLHSLRHAVQLLAPLVERI